MRAEQLSREELAYERRQQERGENIVLQHLSKSELSTLEALAEAMKSQEITEPFFSEMILGLAAANPSVSSFAPPKSTAAEEESFGQFFEGFINDANELRKLNGSRPLNQEEIESTKANMRKGWGL